MKELIKAFGKYFSAFGVIHRYSLWKYILIPGLFSIIYFICMIILGVLYFQQLSGLIMLNLVPTSVQGAAMNIILAVLLWLLYILLIFITYRDIILIFFSPILSFLSEKVERLVYNREPPEFHLPDIFRDIYRGLILSGRNLFFMLGFSSGAWFTGFIPVIGTIISPFLLVLVQAYYSGLGLSDYTLERKRFSITESREFAMDNRLTITGCGLGFVILMLVPVVGWFLAPGLGTVASTLAVLDTLGED